MHTTTRTRLARLSTVVGIAALALVGCAPATSTAEPAPAAGQEHIVITDAWVKAADNGMTAAFGIIENHGAGDITLVAASTPAATAVELHETVAGGAGGMQMQEKDGGFTIPTGEPLTLEPGGNHLMLMGLTAPIVAGDEVEITLVFADGTEMTLTAPAKDYSGANEEYVGGTH